MAETVTSSEPRDTRNEENSKKRLGLRTAVRALRHRNFQLFFSGQLISLVGTWMQNIAQDWLVYRLTGSSLLLGVVAFVSQIPIFLLGSGGRNRGRPLQPSPHRHRHAKQPPWCWRLRWRP